MNDQKLLKPTASNLALNLNDSNVPSPELWLSTETPHTVACLYPDPRGAFRTADPGLTVKRLSLAVGLLPAIFLGAADTLRDEQAQAPHTDAEALDLLTTTMAELYGFGWHAMPEGGNVDGRGVYTYPEDEDLDPLVAIRHPSGAQILIYQYAIIAVRTPGTHWRIARMD